MKEKVEEKESLDDWLRLGSVYYRAVLGSILIFCLVFFIREVGKSNPKTVFENADVYKFYESVDKLRKENKEINTQITSFKNKAWLNSFKKGGLYELKFNASEYSSWFDKINTHPKVEGLVKKFDEIKSDFDSLDIIVDDSSGVDKFYFERLDLKFEALGTQFNEVKETFETDANLRQNPLINDWLKHFQVFNNNTLVLFERKFSKKLEYFRDEFRFRGLLIFAVFLCFLFTLWYHIFLDNLVGYINREKTKEWKDYSALGAINNFIILIVVLSIPILAGTKGILNFEKPLWTSPWDASLTEIALDLEEPAFNVVVDTLPKSTPENPLNKNPIKEINNYYNENTDYSKLLREINLIKKTVVITEKKVDLIQVLFVMLNENMPGHVMQKKKLKNKNKQFKNLFDERL